MSDLFFDSLELLNFKSFKGKHQFKLGRDPGLYYVTGKNKLAPHLGPNGTGKTTITVDALMWVLWNKTERDSRPANAIVPWDMDKGICSVALKLVRRGRTLILTRTRRPNELTLTRKGETRTIDQQEVQKLIGMSEEMFRRTIVLGQFGSLFLDLRAEQQSAMFNEALNLDVWLRASQAAGRRRKSLDSLVATAGDLLSRLQGQMEALGVSLETEKESAESYSQDLSARLTAMDRQIKEKTSALAKLPKPKTAPAASSGGKAGKAAAKAPEDEIASLRASWRALSQHLAGVQAAAKEVGRQIARNDAEIAQYEAAIAGNRACPACGQKSPVKHLETKAGGLHAENAELAKRQAEAAFQIKNLPLQLDQLDRDVRELEEAKAAVDHLQVEINSLTAVRDRMANETNPHTQSIVGLRRRIAANKEEQATADGKLTEHESAVEVCEYWMEAFKEIRLGLIDQVLEELEMAVGRHVENLGLQDWRIKFQTERVTQSGSVSTAFTIMLYPPDQEEPVKFESYSGGESQRWQMAVAFGLSEVILARAGVNPNIEIYDEPTTGTSPEGVEDLLQYLQHRAHELERTIYVIEHHSLERGMFSGTIMVEKDKAGSHVVE